VSYRIIPTPRFQKDVKSLNKKYRHIVSDLEEFNNVLSANPFYGEEIPGLRGKVLKARLACSDMRKGKGRY
jgi:mRNA-degrading endonuclease RelE of RelBE toxin-antitoxin system